jgi:hypothetical protein
MSLTTKTPYGPTMTAKLPQDSVSAQLATSAKKPGPIYPSGTLGVSQTGGASGMKHKSASPPLAGNL